MDDFLTPPMAFGIALILAGAGLLVAVFATRRRARARRRGGRPRAGIRRSALLADTIPLRQVPRPPAPASHLGRPRRPVAPPPATVPPAGSPLGGPPPLRPPAGMRTGPSAPRPTGKATMPTEPQPVLPEPRPLRSALRGNGPRPNAARLGEARNGVREPYPSRRGAGSSRRQP